EDGIRDKLVTGVQTCALPICAVKFTASSAGIVVYHNTLIAPVKPMLLAASNVHYRNNLILGKSETPEIFAVETNTNYSSSDYNGFRPNEGAEFSFEWSTPPFAMRSNFPGRAPDLGAYEVGRPTPHYGPRE